MADRNNLKEVITMSENDELINEWDYSEEDEEETCNELTAYDLAVFYNTYNLSALLNWWGKKLIVPDFQRSFVWNQKQASEFVDSILRGLPVPSIFFYDDTEKNRLLVIDGQQRLTSLFRFIKQKTFNEKAFKLVGSIHPKWVNKTYDQLEDEDRERLDDTLLNITVMRQLRPYDGQSSMYLAFQRINTGGKTLTAQEIRMAVSSGALSRIVSELATDPVFNEWEFLRTPNDRKNNNYTRIQELIVRFWTFFYSDEKGISGTLRSSLDAFFASNKDFEKTIINNQLNGHKESELRDLFKTIYYLRGIDSSFFIPDTTRPTSIFFESVWLGIAFRIRNNHEVTSELIKNKIAHWKESVGYEAFSSMFKARRSSSVESINARISNIKGYFLEDN